MKLQEVGYCLKQTATKIFQFWYHNGGVLSNNDGISADVHGEKLRKLLLSGYWNKSKTVVRLQPRGVFLLFKKGPKHFYRIFPEIAPIAQPQ